MDVERTVASRISASIGVDAYLEVPRERPDEFVTVELSSTSGGRFVREAVLAVQSWAATRRRAAEIASLVESAVYNLVDEPEIFDAVPANTYRWPDEESRRERYQTTVELTICE